MWHYPQLLLKYLTPLPFLWEVSPKGSKIHVYVKEISQTSIKMHKWCKCNKMLLLHLSLSCWVFVGCFSSQYVCYNFVHWKIKLLLENDKKVFFVFSAMSTFDTTFLYMSLYSSTNLALTGGQILEGQYFWKDCDCEKIFTS